MYPGNKKKLCNSETADAAEGCIFGKCSGKCNVASGQYARAYVTTSTQNRMPVAGQVMLDPYAPLATQVKLPEGVHLTARTGKAATRPGDAPAILSSLACLLDEFDFGQDHQRPRHSLQHTVVLELDVPTFTSGPAAQQAVPQEHRGGPSRLHCSARSLLCYRVTQCIWTSTA